jgi:uncharacterized protein
MPYLNLSHTLCRATLTASLMVMAIVGAAIAGPLEDGLAAANRGEYATAYRLWRPLADQGDAQAQDLLGLMYFKGDYVQQDYAQAMKWYRLAADQAHADAQNNLGLMYEAGQGVPQNYAEAMKWYRLAADQGNADAQYNLGLMYDFGKHVPQDYAEAAIWYRKAADQGQPDAQNNLGQKYRKGEGVPQDYVQAHMWLNLAASRYRASEKEGRENAVNGRDFVASKMTPSQIAEAQKLAREWKPRKEESGPLGAH